LQLFCFLHLNLQQRKNRNCCGWPRGYSNWCRFINNSSKCKIYDTNYNVIDTTAGYTRYQVIFRDNDYSQIKYNTGYGPNDFIIALIVNTDIYG